MNALTRSFVVAAMGFCLALPASAATYQVSVDTSSLSGSSGYLDFGFAGLADSPAATSFVYALSGGFALGAPLLDGAALVDPHGWRLGNDGDFNAVFQSWQFGSSLQFTVDFGGAWQTATNGSGNTFSLKLWDGGASSSQLTTDSAGDVLRFQLAPGGGVGVETFARDIAGAPSPVTVSAVPEPESCAMLLVGLVAILGTARRRRAIR